MRLQPELLLGGRPGLAGISVYLVAALVLLAIAWGYFAEVDIVVPAAGIVRPDGEVVQITTKVPGKVAGIYAIEGRYVSTGDPLVLLNTIEIRLEREALAHQLKLVERQLQNVGRRIRDAAALHQLEVATIEQELEEAHINLVLETKQHQAQMESADLRLELTRKEYAITRDLFEQGLLSHQAMEQAKTDFDLARADRERSINAYPSDSSVKSLRARKRLIEYEFESRQRDLRSEATPIEARLADLKARFSASGNEQDRRTIRSPATGMLTMVPTLHPGENVEAGTLVATIAPTPIRPVVETWVGNAEAAELKPGQRARMLVDDFHTAEGVISSVGPDVRFSEAVNGAIRVLIQPESLSLRLGIALEVRLITRKERVLSLLFSRIERALAY